MNNRVMSNFESNQTTATGVNRRFSTMFLLLGSVLIMTLTACSPPTLIATLGASTVSGPAPLEITFTDAADVGTDSREWRFSDGSDTATTIGDEGATITRTFTKAGDFTATVRAIRGENSVESTVNFTVTPGPVAALTGDEFPETLPVGESTPVKVIAEDEFGNVIENFTATYEADAALASVSSSGTLTAGEASGTADQSVTVTVSFGGASTSLELNTRVVPAALASLEVSPTEIEAKPNEAVQIIATAFDRFGNEITDADIDYSSASAAGTVNTSGHLTTNRTAGSAAEGVTVTAAVGEDELQATIPVNISPGEPSAVLLTLDTVTPDVQSQQLIEVVVEDEFGNEISDAELTFTAASGAGSVSSDGTFRASTTAGTYPEAVTVTATTENTEVSSSLELTLLPLELSLVVVDPASVRANGTGTLVATATDRFGNALEGAEFTWSVVTQDVGTLSETGELTAGIRAGSYVGSVSVEATLDGNTASGTGNISITPDDLSFVGFLPTQVTLGMEMDQQLVAIAGDKFGNRINSATFAWVPNPDAGAITGNVFTSGTIPGTYADGIVLTAANDGIEVSKEIEVTVEPDRIAFWSDRDREDGHFFLMEPDGTIIKRLELGIFPRGTLSFTPDGRRFAFAEWTLNGGVFMMDEEVFNPELVFFNDLDGGGQSPQISPDGKTVVLSWWDFNAATVELVLVDIDGGNLRQLTTVANATNWSANWSPDGNFIIYEQVVNGNSDIVRINVTTGARQTLANHLSDEAEPVYSPDGTKILYRSAQAGSLQIWVMNADGSGKTQLTNTTAQIGDARWNLDGTEIIYVSTADGDADIFTMNPDGSNQVRLANTSANDLLPTWAPRKAGVQVNSDALFVIPEVAPADLSTQDLTKKLRPATVKITTDLGSGSGFFVREGGFILTNNHVVVDATTITVEVEGGETFTATLLGRDLIHDLAVLKIALEEHAVVEFGEMTPDDLGREVVAFGFPLGASSLNVTRGVVSGLIDDNGRVMTWVQTDAAVNPGNSGGPLVTGSGSVVGIVTSRFTGDVENVAFAVDAVTINTFLDTLIGGTDVVSASG